MAYRARHIAPKKRSVLPFVLILVAVIITSVAVLILAMSKPAPKQESPISAETNLSEPSVDTPSQEPSLERKAQFSAEDEELLTAIKNVPELEELLALEELEFSLIPRTIMLMRSKSLSAEEAYEEIKQDKDYVSPDELDWESLYEGNHATQNTDSLLVCVNKQNYVDDKYRPDDLVSIPIGYYGVNSFMRNEAADAVVALIDGATSQGYPPFYAMSSFRDYTEQEGIYNSYVTSYGQESADRYSARAGFSDHHTGLATDFGDSVHIMTNFNEYEGYSWVLEHAADYGFILRYPQHKEYITGYEYENWHFRYVGVEAARIIAAHSWTLEEYLILFG